MTVHSFLMPSFRDTRPELGRGGDRELCHSLIPFARPCWSRRLSSGLTLLCRFPSLSCSLEDDRLVGKRLPWAPTTLSSGPSKCQDIPFGAPGRWPEQVPTYWWRASSAAALTTYSACPGRT